MPFTIYHLGPALLLGIALSAVFDLPTLIISSVISDIEPFYVLYFQVQGIPIHGFLHSYIGAAILAIVVADIVILLGRWLDKIMTAFRLTRISSMKKILFTSVIGVYSHMFLDSFLYSDITPFYPLQANPFFNLFSASDTSKVIYAFCSVTGILGVAIYWLKIRKSDMMNKKDAPSERTEKLTTRGGNKQSKETEKTE